MHAHVTLQLWELIALLAAALVGGILIGWKNGKSYFEGKESAVKTQVKSWFDQEIIKAETAVAKVLATIKSKI